MADDPRNQDELVEETDTESNRGYDEGIRGSESVEDIDPDSAESEVERDDTQTD